MSESRSTTGRPAAGGLVVTVSVPMGGDKEVVSIPRAALLRTAEGEFVYTVSGEHFVRTPVKIGAMNADFAEITDGLYAGDQIVVSPVNTLWMAELQSSAAAKPAPAGTDSMLNRLLEIVMRQRPVVLLATMVLLGIGVWSALRLPIDAVPDITNPQVQINTAVPRARAGGSREARHLSHRERDGRSAGHGGAAVALEVRAVANHDDVPRRRGYLPSAPARDERLAGVLEDLPPGLTPKLAPIATGLGEIFYYSLDYTADAPHNRRRARSSSWRCGRSRNTQVKPLLRSTPGVAEVNTSGGYEKQIVIQPDPGAARGSGHVARPLAESRRAKHAQRGRRLHRGRQRTARHPRREPRHDAPSKSRRSR